MRIFLAVDIPNNIKNRILELEDKLKVYSKYMRLTKMNNMHITVKFLGEQNDFAVDKIIEITKNICSNTQQFNICLEKSGIFGGIKNPRILWLGQNNENFTLLSLLIHKELEVFRFEDKKPVCHLTIGRIKSMNPKNAVEVLDICSQFVKNNNMRFDVYGINLYKSTLLKSGAVYEKIKEFKFKERM